MTPHCRQFLTSYIELSDFDYYWTCIVILNSRWSCKYQLAKIKRYFLFFHSTLLKLLPFFFGVSYPIPKHKQNLKKKPKNTQNHYRNSVETFFACFHTWKMVCRQFQQVPSHHSHFSSFIGCFIKAYVFPSLHFPFVSEHVDMMV